MTPDLEPVVLLLTATLKTSKAHSTTVSVVSGVLGAELVTVLALVIRDRLRIPASDTHAPTLCGVVRITFGELVAIYAHTPRLRPGAWCGFDTSASPTFSPLSSFEVGTLAATVESLATEILIDDIIAVYYMPVTAYIPEFVLTRTPVLDFRFRIPVTT